VTVAETETAAVIAHALLRTPRDVKLLTDFVAQAGENDRGRRAAEALLGVEGIPEVSECPLTATELLVVRRLGEGLVYKQIAATTPRAHSGEGSVSVDTIRSHVHNAFCKLGVHDRAQLVIRCWNEGWL
jgi:DNA-binding NarL/FixJ family response regulator